MVEVDVIGGLYVDAVRALCTARNASGWKLVAATDHFLFWEHA